MSDLHNFKFEGEVARFDIDELLNEIELKEAFFSNDNETYINQSGKDNDFNTSADINSSEINTSASVNNQSVNASEIKLLSESNQSASVNASVNANEINLLADIDSSGEIKLLSEFDLSGKDNDLNENASLDNLLDSNLLFKGERLMDKNNKMISARDNNQSADIESNQSASVNNQSVNASESNQSVNASEINARVNSSEINASADNDLYIQHAYNIKDKKVAEALIIYLSGMRVGNIDKFCKARKITKPTLYANISKIEEANNIDLLKIAKDNATLIKDFTRIINSLNALKHSYIDILRIVGNALSEIIANEANQLKKGKQ